MITLTNLHEATHQAIFEQVAKHLLGQNERSMDKERKSCRYRSFTGLSCSIGCLMSDEDYEREGKNLEGTSIAGINSGSSFNKLPINTIDFLIKLQAIHDNQYVEEWKTSLICLAENYNLDYCFLVTEEAAVDV